ncbi:ATP synthase F0 subcomplex B subunit [Syntrophus gentianae]|uniref:ATP synthase subunit b n=1 Tax=Syntrophus gentianae TaxID=43775 RepID=A0A1H7VN02_9BACT|nr:F0F1 ATP synthase subunit delta [Syntrophus gentianae]SEM10616.1 ATP synthase F0 subcomplex B subunit [Syntrophus gentianae]
MQIDWFVLFAQLVNFLILIYLLKRFLYTRIISAMNEREAKIVARFEEAERLTREAEEAARAYEEKNSSLQVLAEKMLNEAREAANRRQKEWMDSARGEVDSIRQRWVETVLQEKESFLESLRSRTGKQVYAIARRILADLADTVIEQKMIDVLIDRIRSLDPKEGEAIRSALENTADGVMVQSAFPLAAEDRQRLTAAVRGLTGKPNTAVLYQESPDLINGIELLTSGHRISWSISEYLDHLEESFDRALHEEVRQTLPKRS